MDTLEFVNKLKDVVLRQNLATYRELYETTVLDEKVKEDPYWNDALLLYNSLTPEDREKLFKIIELTIIDTTSIILGAIDGVVTLENIKGDFLLNYSEFEENKGEKEEYSLNYLQDEFLNSVY